MGYFGVFGVFGVCSGGRARVFAMSRSKEEAPSRMTPHRRGLAGARALSATVVRTTASFFHPRTLTSAADTATRRP
jgi:hypothetical protein